MGILLLIAFVGGFIINSYIPILFTCMVVISAIIVVGYLIGTNPIMSNRVGFSCSGGIMSHIIMFVLIMMMEIFGHAIMSLLNNLNDKLKHEALDIMYGILMSTVIIIPLNVLYNFMKLYACKSNKRQWFRNCKLIFWDVNLLDIGHWNSCW